MSDKINNAGNDKTGNNVIDHYPDTAWHLAIKPAYWPGFPDIQHTKHHKSRQHPTPVVNRQRHQRYPHADEFIPDDAAVIMYAHITSGLMTDIHAQAEA